MKDIFNKFENIVNKFNSINNIFNKSNEIFNQYNNFVQIVLKNEDLYKCFDNYFNSLANKINKINNLDRINNFNNVFFCNTISKINLDTFNNASKYFDDISEIDDIKINKSLKSIESAIPQYIGYAYRKDSKINIEEAYSKSIIKDIEEEAAKIFLLINAINDKRKDFFKSHLAVLELIFNIKNIAENKEGFSEIITYFFKAIYEGSNNGYENQIYGIVESSKKDDVKFGMDLIKHMRSYFQHIQESTGTSHKKFVNKYIQSNLGKEYAIESGDWTKLQLALYKDISKMLSEVLEEL